MGILEPSGTPGRPTLKPKPAPSPKPSDDKSEVGDVVPCDRCGYSKIDGQPVARAKAHVYVFKGSLYLCGHCLRENLAYILERNYYFRSLV